VQLLSRQGRGVPFLPQSRRRIVSSISSPRPGAKSRLTPMRRKPAFSSTRREPRLSETARAYSGRSAVSARRSVGLRSRRLPPERSVYPVGHLRLIVDSEGRDRSSECSVDIDDSVRDARVGPLARHPVEKRAAIGLILGREGSHSDRLRIRHLLKDRVEIPILERPQRDVHLGIHPKRVEELVVAACRLGRDRILTRPLHMRTGSSLTRTPRPTRPRETRADRVVAGDHEGFTAAP
jgi:hypothetical protein